MSLAAARFLRGRLQPGQTDDAMDDGAPGGNDDPQLEEAFLFLAVLACLVCCCFSTCIVRRLRRLSGYGGRYLSAELTQPLLDEADSEAVFRDGDGWRCPICALENRVSSGACDVCGLSQRVGTGPRARELEAKARLGAGYASERSLSVPDEAKEDEAKKPSRSPRRKGSRKDAEAPLFALNARQRRAARRRRWRRALDEHGVARWRLDGDCGGAAPSGARGCVGAVVHALLDRAPGATALVPAEGAAASPEEPGALGAQFVSSAVLAARDGGRRRRRTRRGDAAPRSDDDGDAAPRLGAFAARAARARALSEGDDDDEEDEEDADEEAPRQTSAEAAARERAEELDRVAGLPFREKHLWLEKRLEDLRCAPSEGYVRLEIRRHCLLEDSVHQVLGLEPRSLRQWMRVQFVDEPGIDVGGIEREWFGLASEAVFDPAVGVFRQAPGDGGLIFDASASLPAKLGGHPRARELYEFAGRLLAKALVERIPVAAPLSLPLYKQLVGAPLEYDDLECLDPDLCRNLDWLLHNDGVDALDLDFSVATPRTCPFGGADPDALGDDDDDGEARDVDAVSYVLDTNLAIRELCERGRDVKVTDRNKRTYVDALWRHHVLEAHKDATWHLAKGVYSVLPPDLLAVFDAYELELLLCGSPTIDVADWAKHTEYAGEYRRRGDRHAVIAWFWKAVAKLDDADRSKLLQFCTGSSRVPCHGFRALQRNDGKYQRFCIQSLPRNELRFPRAHTCFNRIDLPLYSSYAELEAGLKVLIAMDATGFTMD